MSKKEIKIAKVTSAKVCFEGHGLLTILLSWQYGDGWNQGFPCYNFSGPNSGMESWFIGLMGIAEVDEFAKIVGKYIRVELEDDYPIRVGHVMKDAWFNPKDSVPNS